VLKMMEECFFFSFVSSQGEEKATKTNLLRIDSIQFVPSAPVRRHLASVCWNDRNLVLFPTARWRGHCDWSFSKRGEKKKERIGRLEKIMTEIHVVLMGGYLLCATWTENQMDEKRKEIKRLNWTSSSWQIESRHVSFCETFYFFFIFFLLRRCGCCCCNVVYLIWQNENAPIYLGRKKKEKLNQTKLTIYTGQTRLDSDGVPQPPPHPKKITKIQRAL
jgi:hypothetical protein